MQHRTFGFAAAGLLLLGVLGGCSQAQQALGFGKDPPDEFQVVSRAPLSMPPDYRLRPPQPGAPRPQESSPRELAQSSVFGGSGVAPGVVTAELGAGTGQPGSSGELALLQNAGAVGVDPQIRQLVDRETARLAEEDQAFIDRLIFWRDPDPYGEVVDPVAEQQRLQENAALGRPVTEGETPVIIRKKRALLEGIF